MKAHTLLITLGLSLLSLPSLARVGVACSASDTKWEEHWSGHSDCEECMREHGSCIESCSLSFYTCEVRGTDYQRNPITLKGSGVDRYEAERNALNYCQRNFYDCSIVTCSTENEEVSRRQCPQLPAPAPAPKPPAPAPKPPAPAPKPVKPTPTPTPGPRFK